MKKNMKVARPKRMIFILFVSFFTGDSTVDASSLSLPVPATSSIPFFPLQKLKRIKIYGCTGVCAAGVGALTQMSPLASNKSRVDKDFIGGRQEKAPLDFDTFVDKPQLGSILPNCLDWMVRWEPWIHNWIQNPPRIGLSSLCSWWMTIGKIPTVGPECESVSYTHDPMPLTVLLGYIAVICIFMIQFELISIAYGATLDKLLNVVVHQIPWEHMMNSVPKRQGGGFVII